MGFIVNDAIIVSSWDRKRLLTARERALKIGLFCTEVCQHPVNCESAFLVVPDGFKEDWHESDMGDAYRATFMDWLDAQAYEDGRNALHFVCVRYSGDFMHAVGAQITRMNRAEQTEAKP